MVGETSPLHSLSETFAYEAVGLHRARSAHRNRTPLLDRRVHQPANRSLAMSNWRNIAITLIEGRPAPKTRSMSEIAWLQQLRCFGNTLSASMQTRTIRLVLFWCLPTFGVFVATVVLVATHFYTSAPFRHRLLFDDIWMGVVVFLPISTVVAGVKAVALRFHSADARYVWQPIVGWGAVLAAAALNVLFYRVVADTLR
jgi:hypothetical protein